MAELRKWVQDMFQRMGWEVRRNSYPNAEQVLLTRFLEVAVPNMVLDVGANVGQYATMLRKCGFREHIVSFEVQAAEHAELTLAASRDVNWIVAPRCALGRTPGEAKINIARNSLSSSLLPMLETHLRAAPESRYVATEEVRVERLDELAAELIPKNARVLLKVDTQGYEEEVLMGAGAVMEKVCALQLEMSVTPLYQGAPSMRRMLEVCEQLGFELHSLMPGFHERRSGRLLQIDGFFLRKAGNDSR